LSLEEEPLSIIDLINYGTLDARLAGFLWLLMENRASVMVAAGPSYAGKTTLLNALLDFLRPEIQQVHLQGAFEDFRFLLKTKTFNTYLVAEELSSHQYEYLWGKKARKTFQLLSQGYAFGTTVHARSAKEVVYLLHNGLGISLPVIARIGAIITLRVLPGKNWEDEPARRIDTINMLSTTTNGLNLQIVAARGAKDGEYNLAADNILQSTLADKFFTGNRCIGTEITKRERILAQLRDDDITSHDEVREAIIRFYKS